MRALVTNFHDLEMSTLQDFAYRTIGLDTVQGYLDRIHVMVVGLDELESIGSVGILQLLAASMEVNTKFLQSLQSRVREREIHLYS